MNKNYIVPILFASIFFSCNRSPNDKEIVLKIGKLAITKHEFERNKSRELGITDASAANVKPKEILEWKNNYIEKCYIVADAYEKSYDTIASFQKTADKVGNEMMVQLHGYLWQKVASPIVDTFKIANGEKLKKRKKIFYFDYIQSPDKENIVKQMNNDTMLKTRHGFEELKKRSHNVKNITTGYISSQWPFYTLGAEREYLYNMKEGEVSKIIKTKENYAILYLDHIENVEPGEKDKEFFQNELQQVMEQEINDKKTVEMETLCKPILNQVNIDTLYQFIKKGNPISQFKKDIEFMRYSFNNKQVIINTNAFIQYYFNLVFIPDITSKDQLTGIIKEIYESEYLLDEAKRLDVFNSDNYKLDKKNFLNNILFGEYISREIGKNIKTDSIEIINYYQNKLNLFAQPKKIVANLYSFSCKDAAYSNCMTISEFLKHKEFSKTKDTNFIKGLTKFSPSVVFDMESNEYSKELKNTLISIRLGTSSQKPLLYKGEYVIIHNEKEDGKSVRKLSEVYNYIENLLKNEKIEKERKALVAKLKKKYKIEIDKTGI